MSTKSTAKKSAPKKTPVKKSAAKKSKATAPKKAAAKKADTKKVKPGGEIKNEIIKLHVAGKTNKEIVAAGYNKHTVSDQVYKYKNHPDGYRSPAAREKAKAKK